MSDSAADEIDEGLRSTIQRTLSRHPVSFAMLFGSVTGDDTDPHDIDIAIEFEERRPADDGYSALYLRLLSDLSETLDTDVDLVDVHTMSPQFAAVAFDSGKVLVGPTAYKRKLEQALCGDQPSVEDAQARVSAAVERLRESS